MADLPNPYQPPDFSGGEDAGTNAGDFSIGRALDEAWEATKRYFPLWLGVGIVGAVIAGVAAITIIGYFLVLPVLAFGGIKFLLNMLDGKAEFNDLFSGFSNYGSVLGRMLLTVLIIMAVALVSESVLLWGTSTQSTGLTLIGALIYMAAFALVIVPLSFSYFFVVDQNMGAVEALSASWRISRGKVGKLIALTLLAGLISALGLLALIVGVLFTGTVSYAMFASAYRQLTGPAPEHAGEYRS
jgi:hypothetical protein